MDETGENTPIALDPELLKKIQQHLKYLLSHSNFPIQEQDSYEGTLNKDDEKLKKIQFLLTKYDQREVAINYI